MQMLGSLEEGDAEASDDEIEVRGQQADYRCPLTLTLFTDPVSSYVSASIVCNVAHLTLKLNDNQI